jgi:hypothetical protein
VATFARCLRQARTVTSRGRSHQVCDLPTLFRLSPLVGASDPRVWSTLLPNLAL